ncbi:DNA recombination protein RmuC [Psychromonas sp. Urea-02u-13]|uniref:DNA recombination protein RmuC n=1 Tax=Psychromonas sp. Urea-02u-13 TaxID=2058326 RepID=UPI000C324BA8|nr:DNA recombination protein RmuC [Psychromonas sp. Urea-02u-13]PKG39184.1 DNA recombination protein RmuC [Psychromonas sp. Urea-02u-13]
MNFTPIEIAILAIFVFISLLFIALYLRTRSTLQTTLLLNEQAQYFHQESLENKIVDLEACQLLTESLQLQNNKLTARLRESEVRLQAGEQRLRDQQASEEKLSSQFELLSQRIFNDKSAQFKTLNQESLNQLLAPFKVQLEGFKQQVSDCYINEGKERYNLQEEIKKLSTINQLMQQETSNLTNALKGDNKQMGNWGEVVLQRILENSGLREGHEYETQAHYKNESGQRFLPDVVVHLPQNKNIIIDSKVSLVAYERFFNSEDISEQKEALKAHTLSVRQHIKGLAKKDYQNLIGANSLDYVLLFVAVEPAFIAAIENDPELVKLALDNNILLASPTNLMIALRTIENLWRYDSQEKNGRLIANQAGKLYDKLRLFSHNMLEVGAQLGKAQDSYDHALKQFSEGRGNIIAQAESLKSMGVTVNKPLPETLVSLSQRDESQER